MRTLVTAARIRTADTVVGDALLVRDGVVEATGPRERFAGTDAVRVDLPGAVVVPGFVDSHLHPVGYAAAVRGPVLASAGDFTGLGELLAGAAAEVPAGHALVALRLDENRLTEGRLPTADDLDRWTGDVPTLAYRYCGHVAVANHPALRLAGVDESTPDPSGGSFDRDETGRPTGVLRETAIDVVAGPLAERLAPPTAADLVAALSSLAALGLTRVGAVAAFGSSGLWCGPADEVALLTEVADMSPIDLHVFVIAGHPDELEAAARRIDGPLLHFAGVKVFADGSFGGRTAALWEPYADSPERGVLRLRADRDLGLVAAARRLGGTAAIHAIGDRAIDATLDLIDGLPVADPPIRIEHVSLPSPAAIARMAELNVVASVQPPFLASETGWLRGRIGERVGKVYPFASLRRAGILTVGGSDSPVEPPDPLLGIVAAQTRYGIAPAEALSGAEALALYTDDAHRALRLPPPFTPGSPADFVVLDGDPVEVDRPEIRRVWKGGRALEVSALPWPG